MAPSRIILSIRVGARRAFAPIAIGMAWLALMGAAPSGAAAQKPGAHTPQPPQLSWSLPRSATEGAGISVSWRGSQLGPPYRLVVQKPEGTAHVWRTIFRLPSKATGSAQLPGLPLGKYRLRIADLVGRKVLAHDTSGIAVFGRVAFSKLLENDNWRDETFTTPTFSFPFVTEWEGLAGENPVFRVEHNNCLSAHLDFVPSAGQYDPGSGTITLVQESRDPVASTVAFNALGSIDADLTPGQSWAVNGSYKGDYAPQIYINGYAVCDSTESAFP